MERVKENSLMVFLDFFLFIVLVFWCLHVLSSLSDSQLFRGGLFTGGICHPRFGVLIDCCCGVRVVEHSRAPVTFRYVRISRKMES